MASDRPLVRLGDYVDACLGKMLDAQKNRGQLQPYLGNSNVRWGAFDLEDLAVMRFEAHEDGRYGIRDGDLIVCEGGEPGRCAIWRGEVPMKIQKALHRVRTRDGLDNYYLYYWFLRTGTTGELEPFFTGTTIKHLTGKALAELRIPLPPIEEQREVAKVLKSLDAKIDLNRRINQTLEAMAQAIFKSWFVDFDPVKAKIAAKAEGRDPLRAAMTAISGKPDAELDTLPPDQFAPLAATAALFPDEMEDSTLGEVPKGWRAASIYEIADVIYGAPFSSKRFNSTGKGLPIVRIRDLRDESPAVWTDETHPKGYLLTKGDIVVGMDGEFRAYLWGGAPAWLNQRVCVFKPRSPHGAAFVRCSIAAPLAHIEATEVATTVIHLGKGDIDKFLVVVPDEAASLAFGSIADSLYAQVVSNKEQTRQLSDIRDTLLPKLLSGELQVQNVEAEAAA